MSARDLVDEYASTGGEPNDARVAPARLGRESNLDEAKRLIADYETAPAPRNARPYLAGAASALLLEYLAHDGPLPEAVRRWAVFGPVQP